MTGDVVSRVAIQDRRRALAKTLGYRILMIAISITVAWLVVGEMVQAVNIGIATNLVKTGTYYAYERSWDHVRWGVPAG